MFKSFFAPEKLDLLDVEPFLMKHKLIGNPLLTVESLAQILPELEPSQVMYSKGLSDLGINFDRAHLDHKNGLSLEETILKLKETSSYIAVKYPERHPAFKKLFSELVEDIGQLMRIKGSGNEAKEAVLWLFIASPNAMTPFHFDRYSNFLMQIRGSKEVAVFPPLCEEVISASDYEAYMDRTEQRPPWKPEVDHLGKKFQIKPGDMVHIPYTSGHYVKNGPEDISITLSVFFNTDETEKLTKVMRVNHRLRKRMSKFGLTPTFAGKNPLIDSIKASLLPLADFVGRMLGIIKRKVAQLRTTRTAIAQLP